MITYKFFGANTLLEQAFSGDKFSGMLTGFTCRSDATINAAIILETNYIHHPKNSDPIAVIRQVHPQVAKAQRNAQKRELAGRYVW